MVDKSEKVAWLARLGYAVRGLVYVLLGWLALTATGRDKAREGTSGMLGYLQDVPGGTAILWICAAGLFGYALYKAIAALFDTEHFGADGKEAMKRAVYFVSAVVYSALAWTALRLAMGSRETASDNTRQMAESTLTFDLGAIALGLAGIALIIGAGVQAKQAATDGFMQHISANAPEATVWLGRAGLAARSVVFLLMGISLVRSAWLEDSGEAHSLGQSLMDLREMGAIYTLVAIGLILFGLFSLVSARYRIIGDLDPGIQFPDLKRASV